MTLKLRYPNFDFIAVALIVLLILMAFTLSKAEDPIAPAPAFHPEIEHPAYQDNTINKRPVQ